MCGLAGILARSDRPELSLVAGRMTRLLDHRGPDSRGAWSDPCGRMHLGHTRLAVQDLSHAGRQPMFSSCGQYVLVLNGEIYNHREVRRGVQPAQPWRGHSDTESFLESISYRGVEATLRLANGMFAFALWDVFRGELTLGRDRIGEKPLYWGEVDGHLLFASELRSILRSGLGPLTIEPEAISALLNLSYIPDPLTILRGVHKLEPGTWVQIRPGERGFETRVQRYWSLEAEFEKAAAGGKPLASHDWHEQVESALSRSVEQRLISDVPVGAFLSGGVDSGLIVALMAKLSNSPVRTFTIGMPGERDESPRARRLAEHLGTEHTEIPISEADCLDVIPELPRVYSEPFGDSSQIPTLVVSEAARKHVTVVLSGDGGDEIFAGYHRHFTAQSVWRRLQAVPLPLRRLSERVVQTRTGTRLARAGISSVTRGGQQDRKRLRLSKGLHVLGVTSEQELYERLVVHWPSGGAPLLKTDRWRPRLPSWVQDAGHLSVIERFGAYDLLTALPGDMLVKVDRASMAHALEVRVPFLDHELIELSLRVPTDLKASNGQGKVILRDLLARHAPPGWMEEPEAAQKAGFGVPVARWLRNDLRPWAESLLSEAALKEVGIWDVKEVRSRWDDFQNHNGPWEHPFWTLLMLQAWLNEYRDVISWN